MNDIVGGKIFSTIKSDPGVVPDLSFCLYCRVSQNKHEVDGKFSHRDIDYRIPLNCISGDAIKQCPACKTVYILRDPTE